MEVPFAGRGVVVVVGVIDDEGRGLSLIGGRMTTGASAVTLASPSLTVTVAV